MKTDSFAWLDFGFDFEDAHSLAEMIELMIVFNAEPFLSLTELRLAFPAGNQPTELQMSFAFSVIDRRRATMGRHYPFKRSGRGIEFRDAGNWKLYAFLLLLSFKNTRLRVEADWRSSDPIFDTIVLRAAMAKLGGGSQGVIFGWPVRGGRPSNFPDAVEWVGNKFGVPLRTSKNNITSSKNDAGVDVIVWTPFADGASGFPVILIQNTIQQSFADKPRDVRPLRWREWLELGAAPIVGFAVPFSIAHDHKWREDVTSEATYFFDRGRLIENLRREVPEDWDDWSALEIFVDDELRSAPSSSAGVQPTGAKKKAGRRKQL